FEIGGRLRIGTLGERMLGIIGDFQLESERLLQGRQHRRDQALAPAAHALGGAVYLDRPRKKSIAVACATFVKIDQSEMAFLYLDEIGFAKRLPYIGGVELTAKIIGNALHMPGKIHLQLLGQ